MEYLRYKVGVNSRRLRIRPLGDLQMGAPGFRKDLWERWKRDALEDKNSLILGMGDYSDRFRTTVDKKLVGVLASDTSAWAEMDELLMKEMQGIAEELKPFRHRILGLHCGHHHHKLLGGGCTDMYLAQLLRVKHLGFEARIQLVYKRLKGEDTPAEGHVIDIWSTHGKGGASSVAQDLRELEAKISPHRNFDIFFRGHSTRAYAIPGPPKINLSRPTGKPNDTLREIKRGCYLVNTGGFMEGRVEGITTYPEQGNMTEIVLGWCIVEIHIPPRGDLSILAWPVTEVSLGMQRNAA